MFYYRLCNSVADKGLLIPTDHNINSYLEDTTKDYYISLYQYNKEQKEKFDAEGSIAGITDVTTKFLIFDFDSKEINASRLDAIESIERLNKLGVDIEEINIYFSGNKGFHIVLDTSLSLTPKQAKDIAKNIAGDLKTFDSVIYNANRIIRLPYTKHQVSGLYKIPLTFEELRTLTIDEIKEIAKDNYEPEPIKQLSNSDVLLTLLKNKEPKQSVDDDIDLILDFSKKPRDLSSWKYALENGLFPSGQRSNTLMILAATYRNLGYSKTKCYYALKATAELQSKRFKQDKFDKQEIYHNVIKTVYSNNWQGGTYAEENFPEQLKEFLVSLNIPRSNSETDKKLESVDQIFDNFYDYAKNIDKNTIKTGIPGLDSICRITTSMLVGLLGSPSVGKTSTMLNLLNNMSLSGEQSVFFSLDMGKPLVYQKLAQKVTGFSSHTIFEIFKTENIEKMEYVKEKINEQFSNVQMCFKTSSTVEQLKEYIINYQNETGKKVRLVAVDYLEKVAGPYSDPTINAGYVAKQLQEMCNELECCVMVLLQPQKMAGTPADPILSYRQIKGASVIEQDCRVVISMWREGYNSKTDENDNYITYAVLKNNMGTTGQVDCHWDGPTGEVRELDDREYQELKELRANKKQMSDIDRIL